MNIEKLAHILLVCVIVVALFAMCMVTVVNADQIDDAVTVSKPLSKSMGDNIKERISTLRCVIEAARDEVKASMPARYFNVPLSTEIQDHIFAVCKEYGIEPEIVIAMIQKESYFNADIMGDNGAAYGILQVHPRWHYDRMERLGVTDLMDPCQNITVAVDYLAECIRMGGGSLDWGLMAYNGGPSYAREMWAKGEVSYYAQIVQKWARGYERY